MDQVTMCKTVFKKVKGAWSALGLFPLIVKIPNSLHLSFLTKLFSSDAKLNHLSVKSTNHLEVNEIKLVMLRTKS